MKSVDTNTTHNAASPSAPRRGRWVVVVMAGLLILLLALLALLAFVSGVGAQGFMSPPMAAAYPTPKDVVGDLGGMPVRIARHIPHLVEYDNDPGWGEKRQGPPPERTHTSRLKSFGVHVRYPDMATLSSPELWAEFEKKRLYNHPWLDFGIQSGSSYPGHGFLDRLYEGTIPNPEQKSVHAQLVPEPSSVKGLELFVPRGNDPYTGESWRYEGTWGDTYIHRNRESGKVTTYIRCTYRSGTRRYASCTQDWAMEEHGLSIEISVNYVPDLLPQWQDIQARVSRFVLDFRDTQAADAAAPALAPTH
jgi:hypothetical protein